MKTNRNKYSRLEKKNKGAKKKPLTSQLYKHLSLNKRLLRSSKDVREKF